MEFYLNLTIRGLCAFVPMAPLDYGERQPLSRMRVLVVDAREPRRITEKTNKPLNICRHIPELRLPDETWPLTGHRIEIEGLDNSVPLLIEQSFGRTAQIERAAPGSGRMKRSLLEGELPEGLVASLDLVSGTVDALAPRWEDLAFQPELVNPAYHGHFASMVHVQMSTAGDEAVLSAIPVRGGTGFKKTLVPRPGHDSVEISLVNLCDPSSHHDGDLESDFAAFYDLSDNYEGFISIPEVLAGPNRERGIVFAEASRAPACIVGSFPGPPRP